MARNPGVLTKNPNVIKWVDEMVALTKPDQVIWIDGSKKQLDELTNEVCSLPDGNKDKMYRLNPEKNCRVAYITVRNPTTSLASRAGLSFAAEEKKTQVPPTTGWILRK